jgi:hypothetical protein
MLNDLYLFFWSSLLFPGLLRDRIKEYRWMSQRKKTKQSKKKLTKEGNKEGSYLMPKCTQSI